MQVIELLKSKRDNWDLLSWDDETKIAWFDEKIVGPMLQTFLQGDPTIEIVVLEEIHELLEKTVRASVMTDAQLEEARNAIQSRVLQTAPVEEDKLKEIVDEQVEGLDASVKMFLEHVQITSQSYGNFMAPEDMIKNADPELIFIQVVTKTRKEREILQQWATKVGIGNMQIEFNLSEVKIAFLVTTALERMVRQPQQAQPPTIFAPS